MLKLLLGNPYVLMAAGIGLLAVGGGGYWLGHGHASDACAAEKLEAVQEAQDEAKAAASRTREVEAQLVQSRSLILELRDEFREQTATGGLGAGALSPVGLCIWNAANGGTSPASCRDAGAVPEAPSASATRD